MNKFEYKCKYIFRVYCTFAIYLIVMQILNDNSIEKLSSFTYNWRPPSLSELTPIISNMGLTNLG